MKSPEEVVKQSCTQHYVQWLATFGVFILMMQVGLYIGWGSPNTARLQSEDSPIHMSPTEITFLLSSVTIGAAIGSIVGCISLGYLGSRKTVLITLVVMGVSWICLILANSSLWIFASRIIGGLPCAMAFGCFSIFVAEISQAKIRGTLISIAVLGSSFGQVLGIVAETYLPTKVASSLYLAQAVIGIILLIWLKDTPYYLMSQGKHQLAENSIIFYQPNCNVDDEMKEIQGFAEKTDRQGIMDKLRELKNPVIRKSMILIILVFALPHMGGFMVMTTYMQVILEDAELDLIKPEEGVIYINIIGVISSILSMNLIDKLGRRFLLLLSSAGVITALTALGIYFHLTATGTDLTSMQWLPIGFILLYMITYSAGFNSVPSTVLSEIFPENMKSTASLMGTLSISFIGLAISNMYQPIIDSFGVEYAFWCFAIFGAVGVTTVLLMLPETKGKTFQEIQDLLAQD